MNDLVQYHLSPFEIRQLPISTKEDNHPSRQRLGYHLFLGYYFSKCSELSPADKHASFLDDDTSFDSTDDPPVLHASKLMPCAALAWRKLPEVQKNAWNSRAIVLNNRPIPGHIEKLPAEVKLDGVELNMKTALEVDWSHFCKMMKKSVTKPPPLNQAELYVRFGGVKTPLSNKGYKSLYLSYLVRIAIFGKYFERLKKHEIVYQTSCVTVIHIASLARMKELFCLGQTSSVLFKNSAKTCTYSTCGKVYLENHDGQEINGYVIKANQRILTVQMENNQIISVGHPKWDEVNFTYQYTQNRSSSNFSITSYEPNIFSVSSSSGQFKFLINRFATDNNNQIVSNYTS